MPKRPEEFIDSIQDESAALKDLDLNNPFDTMTAEDSALPPLLDSEFEQAGTSPIIDLSVNSPITKPPQVFSHTRVDKEGYTWRDADFFFRQGSEIEEIQLDKPIEIETHYDHNQPLATIDMVFSDLPDSLHPRVDRAIQKGLLSRNWAEVQTMTLDQLLRIESFGKLIANHIFNKAHETQEKST